MVFSLTVASCYAPVADAQARVAVVQPLSESRRARPIGRLIRARVSEATEAIVIGSPLGWRDLQLAAGCVGEGDSCFRAVAEQLEVTEIVLPIVERTDHGWVVEIVRWCATEGTPRRSLIRRHGPDAMAAVLDATTRAVRALYDLPPLPEVESAPIASDPIAGEPNAVEVPIGALVMAVGALGVAGVGIAFGLDSRTNRDAWLHTSVDTRAEVDLALAARDRAVMDGLVADTLFAVAAAAALGAVVWLIVELASPGRESQASLSGAGFAFDHPRTAR